MFNKYYRYSKTFITCFVVMKKHVAFAKLFNTPRLFQCHVKPFLKIVQFKPGFLNHGHECSMSSAKQHLKLTRSSTENQQFHHALQNSLQMRMASIISRAPQLMT